MEALSLGLARLPKGANELHWMCHRVSWRQNQAENHDLFDHEMWEANPINVLSLKGTWCGEITIEAIGSQRQPMTGPFPDSNPKAGPDTAPGSVAALGASHCTPCPAGTSPNADRSECVRCDDGQVAAVQLIILSLAQVSSRCDEQRIQRTYTYYIYIFLFVSPNSVATLRVSWGFLW